MNTDIIEALKLQKALLSEDKKRLGLSHYFQKGDEDATSEKGGRQEHRVSLEQAACESIGNLNISSEADEVASEENKENFGTSNVSSENREGVHLAIKGNTHPVEPLDLSQLQYNEKKKRNYADQVASLDGSFMSRSNDRRIPMLRYGEFSPNNPELRVQAQPYLGIGEYEQQKNLLRQRRRGEYLSNGAAKTKAKIQYDRKNPNEAEKELSPQRVVTNTHAKNNPQLTSYRRADDRNLTGFDNNGPLRPDVMDKPKGILTNRKSGSPRDRFMSNLKHTYTPSFMDGFNYIDRTEELDRERKKREAYNYELRMQIEEKRRMQVIKDEQDRREQELENRRLEQQLLRMQEEALVDDPKSSRDEQFRRHSDDYLRRRTDLGLRTGFRKHTDSESSLLGTRNAALSHYSPPVSRRTPFSLNVAPSSCYSDPLSSRYNPHSPRCYDFDSRHRRDTLNRLDSLNVYNSLYDSYDNARYRRNNAFARFDSLSRIDSLGARSDPLDRFESLQLHDDMGHRRHSATHQDLGLMRRSPKLQRRSNSGRFDDQLPIPVLKARSPVARELKNSIPFNSGRNSSEACRKLEDKWQIPAVQKNIVNHSDSLRDGSNRSVLTQLGAIRMQLQQEQLRMDESLRKRGITQSKAVDFH